MVRLSGMSMTFILSSGFSMRIGALEVFTAANFTPSLTNVPGSPLLIGLGLLGLTANGRTKTKPA